MITLGNRARSTLLLIAMSIPHTSPRARVAGKQKQVTPGKATASLALEYSQLQPVVHVIDDDDAARGSLEFLLDTAGFRVRAG